MRQPSQLKAVWSQKASSGVEICSQIEVKQGTATSQKNEEKHPVSLKSDKPRARAFLMSLLSSTRQAAASIAPARKSVLAGFILLSRPDSDLSNQI